MGEIRPKLLAQIEKSYARLAGEYDIIVLEGAGSCAEVNLRDTDIVNFSMAQRAGAKVILVADIDRGGVFAQIVGHVELISDTERERVAGFIINKFRGDVSLLGGGLDFIEERTGKPVFGVVPFVRDLAIMEEDSVALSENAEEHGNGPLKIGVVSLPHVSNTTDFEVLAHDPRVSLSYVGSPDKIKGCHAVILPGTKNTLSDLDFLKETGLFSAILDFSLARGVVVGICGGFQLMGRTLRDPEGVEGRVAEARGLGILPVDTVFAEKKATNQVAAHPIGFKWAKGCTPVVGYEIHMGFSKPFEEARPAFVITRSQGKDVEMADGLIADGGRSWGTYIHGVFDNDDFRERWITGLAGEFGLDAGDGPGLSHGGWREAGYDRLADLVRSSVDLAAIYRELGLSPRG
jgi:adenosylcobyric acid synthase